MKLIAFTEYLYLSSSAVKTFCCCLFVLYNYSIATFGQTRDSFWLPEMTIEATRIPSTTKHLDTLYNLHQLSAGDLLRQHTNIYIKQSAPNLLATPTMRGKSAAQVSIKWNGIPLNSSMNGVFDLSLLPSIFIDKVMVLQGGDSGNESLNALGGVLDFQSASLETPLIVSSKNTSNLGFEQGAKVAWKWNKNQQSEIRLHHVFDRNKFAFKNIAKIGQPIERQDNAVKKQWGGTQSNTFIFSNFYLRSNFLFLKTKRDIPPPLGGGEPSFQEDDNLLFSLQAGQEINRFAWSVFSNYTHENIAFQAPGIMAGNSARNFYLGSRQKLQIKKHQFHQMLRLQHARASTDFYDATQNTVQYTFQYTFAESYPTWNWQLETSVTQSWFDGLGSPFSPMLAWSARTHSHWRWAIKVARNYRIPTLNDRFWGIQGNPNLRAEDNWTFDFSFHKKINKHQMSLSGFIAHTDDWIQWIPVSNGLWTPQNIKSVFARGFSINYRAKYPFGRHQINYHLQYDFIKSTNESVADNALTSLGKQLIYTPKNQFLADISYHYANSEAHFVLNGSGRRYTSSDNEDYLAPFFTGNIIFYHRLSLNKFNFVVNFGINNLWNEDYALVAGRPMPRRYYDLGVIFSLN